MTGGAGWPVASGSWSVSRLCRWVCWCINPQSGGLGQPYHQHRSGAVAPPRRRAVVYLRRLQQEREQNDEQATRSFDQPDG